MIDQALGWVGDVARALREWLLPSMSVVLCSQAGVRYRKGKEPTLLKPGVYWYWSPLTDIEVCDVVQQPLTTEEQHLVTLDGKTVSAGVACTYRITNPLLWDRQFTDPEETLGDASQAAVRRLVVHSRLENMIALGSQLDKALLGQVKRETQGMGVEIIHARFTSLAPSRVLSLLGVG